MPRGAQVDLPEGRRADPHVGRRVPGRARARGRCRLGRADVLVAPGRRARRHACISYEIRDDHLDARASATSRTFFGEVPPNWALRPGDLNSHDGAAEPVDRVVLDMLAPWECLDTVRAALVPGGVLVGYVATTTQLSRLTEALREQQCWTEPQAWESLVRPWHVVGSGGPARAPHDRSHSVPGDGPPARRRGRSAPAAAPSDGALTPFGATGRPGDRHSYGTGGAASRCRPAE